jgi:hypothetical protein
VSSTCWKGWLCRASISPYNVQFILKGGFLLAALDARPTTRICQLRWTRRKPGGRTRPRDRIHRRRGRRYPWRGRDTGKRHPRGRPLPGRTSDNARERRQATRELALDINFGGLSAELEAVFTAVASFADPLLTDAMRRQRWDTGSRRGWIRPSPVGSRFLRQRQLTQAGGREVKREIKRATTEGKRRPHLSLSVWSG